MKLKLLFAFITFACFNCFAQPGSLDLTFSGDGMQTTIMGDFSDYGKSVAIQTDGKIVVAGYSYDGSNNKITVVRYNSNGSLDSGFDFDGIVIMPFGIHGMAYSVAIQPDGKIVVAGYITNFVTVQDIAVVRLNSDGSFDTGFGNGGLVSTDFGSLGEVGYSMAIQPDGKIVVAGGKFNGSNNDFIVVRYNSNGSLDTSFDADGLVSTDFGGSEYAYSLAMQTDGKIVVVGEQNIGGVKNFVVVRYNNDGSLDTGFDTDGIVITNIGIYDNFAYSVAIQTDGKIVVAGYYSNTINDDFGVILRFNSNGSLDTSFDSDGILSTPSLTKIYSVAIQTDGKIVAAGYYDDGSNNKIIVVRYNSNGSLDTGFDTDGVVNINFGDTVEWGTSVAIQADEKIVVVGHSWGDSASDFVVARVNSDGSSDTAFDADGKQTTTIWSKDDIGNSIAIQTDGKIVVVGHSDNGTSNDFAVARYNNDGSLDTDFSTDGKVVTTNLLDERFGRSVAIQTDGKIVVAGYVFESSTFTYDFAVVRYNSDGSLDTSFDTDGIVTTDFGGSHELGHSVAIQPDGKIVVGGATLNGTFDFAVVRYNSDGSLDTGFDTDGIVITVIGSNDAAGSSVAIQTDGKIVVGGYSNNGSNNDFAMVRYNNDGSLDTGFDTDGIVTTDIGGNDDAGYSLAIQTNGKFVVGGASNNGSNNDFALVRYNNDGSLDTGFDTDGIVTTDIGGNDDIGYSLAIQADGKIAVGGASNNGLNNDFALVRYNIDGSLDSNFDTDGKQTTAIGSNLDEAYSVAIQEGGKIILAGRSYQNGNYDFAIARYWACSNTFSSLNASACDSYTWQGNTYTVSGTYSSTIPNAAGCDSVITLNLTIKNTTSSSLNISACNSYTWQGNTYTISGTYVDTIPNTVGCDSILTLNLTINNPTSSSLNISTCDSYTWQGNTYTVSGTYSSTIPNAAGCDSVITLNLTINNTTNSLLNITACDSYTWQGNTYTVSGTYMNTIPNVAGCDSVMNLNLTINYSPVVDLTLNPDSVCINVSSYLLSGGSPEGGIFSGAGVSAGSFNSNDAGTGLHSIVYTYTDGNNCTNYDSAQIFVDVCTGIIDISNDNTFSIFPNPFSTQTTLLTTEQLNGATLTVYNNLGQIVKEMKNIKDLSIVITRDNLATGVYFIRFTHDNKIIATDKLIISD